MKPFELSELDDHDLDEIVCQITGHWPEGWSEDMFRRAVVAGANMMLEQRAQILEAK